jgi:hypothetical protein
MNQPLINFQDYSTIGLAFNGVGCLFWVMAYAVLVWEIGKKKFVEMPAYIAGANIGWELVWSFFYHPDTGLLYSLSYQAAFFLDCYIFYAVLRYGTKQVITAAFRKYFLPFCIINFIFWILFSYTYMQGGYDTSIGSNSGYIINVILSMQCIILLFQTEDTEQFSTILGICRTLGTGLITVSMFIFYPNNYFVQLLGVTCLLLDSTYCYALWQRNKNRVDALFRND